MSNNNLQIFSGPTPPEPESTVTFSPYAPYYHNAGTFVTNTIMSSTITKIAPALVKAQRNMTTALKDSKNPYFKSSYADLNSIIEAVQSSLNDQGISLLQPIVQNNGKNYVRTLLLHESGEFLGSDNEIVVKATATAQDLGSGISYARRYGLQSLLSVKAVDDDGASASGRTTIETTTTTAAKTAESAATSSTTTEATKAPSSFNKRTKTSTPKTESEEW